VQLYCRLVRHTLATAASARVGPIEVWTTPPGDDAFIRSCGRGLGVEVRLQPEGDLGARMLAAARDGLRRASGVIVVGVDCPTMHLDDLCAARDAMAAGDDVVLGPAEDGGYWLIGLTRCDPGLFAGVAWSTASVLADTRARLEALGWRWSELGVRWDVDRPEDLARLSQTASLSMLVDGLSGHPA
jgi:rSAM/selenodomain-associated transferase 1